MRIKSKLAFIAVATSLMVVPISAGAVDTTPEPAPSPEFTVGKKAIDARDWNAAIRSLTTAVQREPRNADVHNLLGFAYRNSGQLEPAFKHYRRALQLDSRHLGAHEYIGEAYLIANDLAKAEEHLAALKRICPAVCEPYDDLNKAIAAYRAAPGSRDPARDGSKGIPVTRP